MIQLKVRRTNNIHGSWLCEEVMNDDFFCMDDPLGFGKSIEDAIGDFIRSYEILKGPMPNYKWR